MYSYTHTHILILHMYMGSDKKHRLSNTYTVASSYTEFHCMHTTKRKRQKGKRFHHSPLNNIFLSLLILVPELLLEKGDNSLKFKRTNITAGTCRSGAGNLSMILKTFKDNFGLPNKLKLDLDILDDGGSL